MGNAFFEKGNSKVIGLNVNSSFSIAATRNAWIRP
jgi:hypothetical protein